MNQLITTNNGGFPFVLNDLRFDQQAVRDAFVGLLSAYGITTADSFILSGCESFVGGGGVYLPGWIFLAGEILKFDGAPITSSPGSVAVWDVDVSYDAAGDKRMENGTTVQTYQVRKAKIILVPTGSAGGYLAYAGTPTWSQKMVSYIVLDNPASELAEKIKNVIRDYYNPLKTKVIDIGDWNMDTISSVSIPHGLPAEPMDCVRSVSVLLRRDSAPSSGASRRFVLEKNDSTVPGSLSGSINYTATDVVLTRLTGGDYDNSNFSSLSFNRGTITLLYED